MAELIVRIAGVLDASRGKDRKVSKKFIRSDDAGLDHHVILEFTISRLKTQNRCRCCLALGDLPLYLLVG